MNKFVLVAMLLLGSTVSAQQPMLTAAEKADGWTLMFDGKSLAGWRGYKTEKPSSGWRVDDGLLVRLGGGGDLMTVEQYGD
ncbi:MAG: family 16 glycoside hydrolase, partial [Acidimicrobiia bacterium]